MGKIKKIVDGVVVEVDDTQMVKTIENGVVVEKPLNQAVKKKVGSVSYEHSPMASGGQSIESPDYSEIISSANEIKRQKENPAMSFRGEASRPMADYNKIGEATKKIQAAGFDPTEIESDFGDFPSYAKGVDIPQLLQEKKDNPLSYKRHLSAYKWQSPLFKAIREKDGEGGEAVINSLLQGQQGSTYESKRQSVRDIIELSNKYLPKDEAKKVVDNLKKDKAFSYGDTDATSAAVRYDPRYLGGTGFNNFHVKALQYLSDTDPETYKSYEKLLSGTSDVKGSALLGYESKSRDLEQLGMKLELDYLKEKLAGLQSKNEKDGSLNEQEYAEADRLNNNYNTLIDEIKVQNERYPKVAAVDADRLAQEAIGQRSGAGKRFVLGVGENVDDAVGWLGDILQSPFRSGKDKTIDDLEELGDKKLFRDASTYVTEENRLIKPNTTTEFSDNLKTQIEQQTGSFEERLGKVRNLILNNFGEVGAVENKDAGKFNLTANAWANAVSDVGKELFSQLAIAGTTGGLGNISKSRQLLTLFGTTFATAYNDFYVEALEKNIPNPTTYAVKHTTIEAASELLNNDLAIAKKMANPKSTMGQILKNVTKGEWDDILRASKGKFGKLGEALVETGKRGIKTTKQEVGEEVAGQAGHNAIEDEDIMEGQKSTLINTTLGMLPLSFLGLPGQISQLNRTQKYALYEAVQNKEKYLFQLEQDVKDGAVTEAKAGQIKAIIENSEKTLNELQEKTTLSDKTDNQKADLLANSMESGVDAAIEKGVPEPPVKGHMAFENDDKETLIGDAKVLAEDLPEVHKNAFNENPEVFLEEAAQQLNGSKAESELARKTYGDPISDIALKLFPDAKVETSAGMQELLNQQEQPHQEQTITPEGIAEPISETNVDEVDSPALRDVETHEQVMGRAKTGQPIEINALRIENKSGKYNDKTGVHFADKGIIDEYKKREESGFYKEKGLFGGEIKSYKLSFKNPLVLTSKEQFVKELAQKGDKEAQGVMPNYNTAKYEHELQTTHKTHAEFDAFVANKARELGHDGIILPLEYVALGDKTFSKSESILGKEQTRPSNEKAIHPTTESDKPISSIKETEATKEVAEPPIPPTETKAGVFVERPKTELSHRGLQVVANEFSLPDVETRTPKTDTELRQQAKETVDTWAEKGEYTKKVDGLVEKAESGEILTDKERVILEGHLANVSEEARVVREEKGVLSKEYEAKLTELKRLKDAGEKTRSEAGAALRIPTFNSRPQTIEDAMLIEKESASVDVLTDKQKETVVKEFEEIKAANDALQQKINALEQENARVKAGEVVSTERKRERKGKKTAEQFKDERAKIISDIRDKLKKSREETTAVGVPYLKELITIAPDIGKLVKNLVEEGVTNLSDIVDNIHGYLKDEINGIEKKDVVDLIAGVYNEKRPTRNDLEAKLVDLREEAKLLNKYDALVSGIEPKSEKAKVQRNREIAELRKKIKDHDLTKLASQKAKIKSDIAKIEEQIKKGDFAKPEPKQQIKLDKEGQALRDKLIKLKQQRDARIVLEQRKKETQGQRALRIVSEVFNIPRTLMTIGDFSGLLRQNIFFSMGHPIMTAKAMPGMFKSFTSQKVYDRWFEDLKESPRYNTIKESRLAIADSLSHDLTEREESFMSTLAEKIPLIGQSLKTSSGKTIIPGTNIVKGSERSYTLLLNKMRVDMFNYFADSMEARGLTVENSPKQYKAMAEYINNATGRSDFGKTLNRVAPVLNATFFSPRLVASRMNMLTYWAQPRFWKTLPKEVKRDYFRNWASFLGVGLTILALAKAGGADDVEDDPRSSDFGKIKDGDTRWDIWGGAQPYVRVMAQLISGQRKSTNTGQLYDLTGDDVFGETRAGVVSDFFRGKLAPVPGAFVDLLSGRTTTGDKVVYEWNADGAKEISIKDYVKERLLPMTITGTQEAVKEKGLPALLTVGVPSVFGIGTQTYGKPVKEVKDEVTYEGQKVKLTDAQRKEYQALANKLIEKNVAKMKTLTDYKSITDTEEKLNIERLVKNESVRKAEDIIIEKYKSTFPSKDKQAEKEKKDKEKSRKQITKSLKQ